MATYMMKYNPGGTAPAGATQLKTLAIATGVVDVSTGGWYGGVDDTENNESASFDYLIKQGMVNIFFNINQENPNSASANNLYYIIQFLKAYPQAKVKVKGYADTSGNEKANANLAKRRADNIANFIIKSGVDANRIEVLGVGVDTNFDNSSKTSLQLARRVSFELIKE